MGFNSLDCLGNTRQWHFYFMLDPISRHISKTSHVFRILEFAYFVENIEMFEIIFFPFFHLSFNYFLLVLWYDQKKFALKRTGEQRVVETSILQLIHYLKEFTIEKKCSEEEG